MIQQEIDLNLIPDSEPVVVHANQYDEGKSRIIAHLYEGSSPYTPGANATVKVQGTKPDDKAFQYWCDLDGSTVTVDVNQQMTAVAGRVPTQLIVNETSGLTGSFAFYLDVQKSTLPSNIDLSETDIPILTEEAQEAAQRATQAAGAAEASAEEAAAWSAHPPYIGENKNWYVYDVTSEEFVDSEITAEGADGVGIASIAKTATSGLVDTYTITFTDESTYNYYVTNGADGNKWYKGTAISGESSTATVFPSSGITKANHNDFYLNTTEGSVYHCETGGDASTATWAYDFKLIGGGSGGVTNYNDLTNKPKIGGVEVSGNKTIEDYGGVTSFNGRSGSILPIAGDYTDSKVILSSTMHIGGETQTNVAQALDALERRGGGGLLPYLYIDSESGAEVTVVCPDSSVISPTAAGSGHWECEVPSYGVYVIHSVLAGQGDATLSVTVDDVKEYHITDSHYDFTINVTADSGATVRIQAGVEVYTGTGTGSSVAYVVHQASTTYTVSATLDGYTKTESVTSAAVTSGSVNVDMHIFDATLSISTTSPDLYSQTITIKKGSTTVGTTAFSSAGAATYRVHESGTYAAECEGFTDSVTVSAETTYNMVINSVNVTLNAVASVLDGETVTAVDKSDSTNTVTATIDNGKAELFLEPGDWIVAGIPMTIENGETYEEDINIFAVHYSETDSNPDSCDYPSGYDNYGWTPFAMDLSTGVPSYGSWDPAGTNADKLAWFYPRSCMLKYNGQRDYYLDESDESKKEDGVTASDYNNTSYGGNCMMEWGQDGKRLYWKIVSDTNNDGWTFIVANADVLGLKPWNHYDVNGEVAEHFYVHKYFGSSDGTRLRSISGQSNYVNNAGTTEISLAEANNQTSDKLWTTGVFCDTMFLGLMCVLISRSLNTQAKFGAGRSASGNTSAIGQGTMNGKGLFYGKSNGTEGVKVFGTENLWGNLYQRIRGLININGSYRIKMTYDTTDGSTTTGYNTDGSGYISAGSIGATATWVYPKHVIVRENCILAQTNGGSETTYYCDGTYLAASGTLYALVGGSWTVAGLGGTFFVYLSTAVSIAGTGIGAALSCKPLAA